MLVIFTSPGTEKIKKTSVTGRKTALSVLISGLCCAVAPVWADCNVISTPNANGGVDITCEGAGISQDTNLLGNQSNNTVTVQGEGTVVNSAVYGGRDINYASGDVSVTRNTVTLNDSSRVDSDVYGGRGYSSGDVSVTGNTVTLNDSSSVNSDVYGGYSYGDGDTGVTGNTVTLNDSSSVNSTVYGGYGYGSGDVSVTGNTVTLNGSSSVNSGVYGGAGYGYGDGDVSVTGNTVTLNDSSSVNSDVDGGYGYGSGDISVTGNTVTLNDSSRVDSDVYGGRGYSSGDISVTGNTVTLNDSSSVNSTVYGGAGIGYGDAGVTGNTVTLNDSSSVNSDVYGGYGYGDGDVSVTGNTVTLNGSSSVNSDVYGGYGISYGSGDVSVTGNTVNINNTAAVSGSLYGGFISGSGMTTTYDGFTGNTLNFAAAPITLSGTVANFENYNFTVDPAFVNTDTALITADTITFGTNDTNMKGGEANTSKIQVAGIKSGDELFADDRFVLMQATGTLSGNAEYLTTTGVARQGISLLYNVETAVDTDGKRVTATILGNNKPADPGKPADPEKPAAKVNPQLKVLSEGHLASAMMLTRGADTLAYDTVHTIQHQNPEKGLAPFITLSGDKTRYNSGSHIDAKDGRLTGGLSWQTDNLVSAVIIESGWGSYDTRNSFTGMKDVNGDGHNRYAGAAVLGHYDFDSGMYAEASLRAGKNRNTFDTKDIVNLSTGEYARYNLDSNYLGAHIGTGYSKALDEKNTADVSAKYLWTQLKGKDVNVAGDTIHFDDINSRRVRLDAGLSHQYTEAVAVRAGLGYEYEFDGKAKATTYGYDIAAPGVQGSTGILTLGSTVTPLAGQPLSVEINLNGYTGKRDGVGGSVKFSYAF